MRRNWDSAGVDLRSPALAHDGPDVSLESGRRTDRLAISMQVRVVAVDDPHHARSFLSRDLNADGMFVRTTHPMAPDTLVRLEFVLPKVRVMRLEGRVARVISAHEVTVPGDAGMGIEFREMKSTDTDALRRYLADHGVR
ncbi:MAG: PilZ domain-containing protein [Deltaproteobacteria bacterium]